MRTYGIRERKVRYLGGFACKWFFFANISYLLVKVGRVVNVGVATSVQATKRGRPPDKASTEASTVHSAPIKTMIN